MTSEDCVDGSETLFIVPSAEDDAGTVSRFVVDEEINEVSVERYERIYRVLSNADIDLGLAAPFYEIAWPHLIRRERGRLLEIVLVYLCLEERVRLDDPELLVCADGLDPAFVAVVSDIGSQYDIEVAGGARSTGRLAKYRRVLVTSVLILPFLLDQLFGLLWKRIFGEPGETPVVYVPALLRLDSMLPVLRESSFPFGVVVTSMASSWLWTFRDSVLAPFDPIPVSIFTSVRSLRRQLEFYVAASRRALLSNHMKDRLNETLESEFDVSMDRALSHAIENGLRTRIFTSSFMFFLFEDLIDRTRPEHVVIGTLSPAGRAIVARGLAEGSDVYHVPHSIATARCPNPRPELTMFVAGELDRRFYEESDQVEQPWQMVVTGRPYLTELYADRERYWTERGGDGGLVVMIVTQGWGFTHEYVASVIDGVEAVRADAEFIIKVHPSQAPEEYRRYAGGNVSIREDDLFECIDESDVTVTVDSNVGIESAILGTPTVCINRWEPVILDPPFARDGTFPVLRTEGDIREYFGELGADTLADLAVAQEDYVAENYELATSAAKNIAAHLQPRMGDE